MRFSTLNPTPRKNVEHQKKADVVTNIKFFSFNVSLLFVRKSRKWSQKNHSSRMMDQNFLSKWSKRSLSIIFIMINYNVDQKMPLSFDPDHKNAPSFCQIKKCSFCFDPNSEPKKMLLFLISFLLIQIKKKSFVWSGSKTYPFFLDANQKFTSIFLIWMKKSFFYPDNFSLFRLKEIFDTDGLFNLVQ